MNSSSTHRSQVEIDLSAFQRTIRVFAGWVGGVEKVFPVIKADAYGHGMIECAQAAQAAGCEPNDAGDGGAGMDMAVTQDAANKLYVGLLIMLIFAEALALYGLIVALILSQNSYTCA